MNEFLHDFYRRGGLYYARGVGSKHASTWFPHWMISADGVTQNCRIQDNRHDEAS